MKLLKKLFLILLMFFVVYFVISFLKIPSSKDDYTRNSCFASDPVPESCGHSRLWKMMHSFGYYMGPDWMMDSLERMYRNKFSQ